MHCLPRGLLWPSDNKDDVVDRNNAHAVKEEDASLDIEKKRGVSPVNPETEGQLLESVSTPTPSGYK